jgi:hypothetical protein
MQYLGTECGKSKYKTHYLHRWILEAKEDDYVDHKNNLDTLDNRKSNLRVSTNAENNWNKNEAYKSNKTTGFRNVNYIPKQNQYRVQIMKDGKRYAWSFPVDKFEEACEFAETKRKELFGDYSGSSLKEERAVSDKVS